MNDVLFSKLLDYFSITEEDYNKLIAPVNENNFDDGHKFDRMDEAVSLVKNAIANNYKIIIYGDYDADGIMGTSILVKLFKYVNYHVDFYIPNRYKDGYGLNLKKTQEIIDANYQMVICVDNGITCCDQIDLLRKNGIEVLVLDHHQPIDEKLPNANCILHPIISNFGDVSSSGGFTAFMFSKAFLNRYDKYLATLASISVVSDMMPLKEYNRNLLRVVFQNFVVGEFPQIDALNENDCFDENSIGMKIAPKINSIGRIIEDDSIQKIVSYFVDEKLEYFDEYLKWINSCNSERKELSKIASEIDVCQDLNDPVIAEIIDIKEGIIGLVANQLCTKYKKPTVIFTTNEEGVLKGSCRAPEGYNIVEIFDYCKDELITFGGHALAGGCSLRKENFMNFKKKFAEATLSIDVVIEEKPTIDLYLTDLNFDNYNLIKSFSPFGEGWKSPLFKIRRVCVKNLFYSKNQAHILSQLGLTSRLVGFGYSKEYMKKFNFIDATGEVKSSTYRNITNIEFHISSLKESE